MIKYAFAIILFASANAFANLYLTTEYQEGNKPKIITKQHIFLDQRSTINYSKKSYVLILKKVSGDEATIEAENYNIDKTGHKTMVGGKYGTYKVGGDFRIDDFSRGGAKLFSFKAHLDKIVPTRP